MWHPMTWEGVAGLKVGVAGAWGAWLGRFGGVAGLYLGPVSLGRARREAEKMLGICLFSSDCTSMSLKAIQIQNRGLPRTCVLPAVSGLSLLVVRAALSYFLRLAAFSVWRCTG